MGIRDLGYKRYEGRRLPHGSRYQVMIRHALARAWATKRIKITLISSLFPMVIAGVVLYFKIKAQQMAGAMGQSLPLGDPSDVIFYCVFWCQIWFAFDLSARIAAPAIAEDSRTGAFQFYFARPVTRPHYLIGKIAPAGILILLLTAGPGLLLSLLRISLASSGDQVMDQLPLVLKTLIFAPLMAASLSLIPVAIGSLGRRSGTVQGIWAAVFFLPWILGESLSAALELPLLTLISIPTCLRIIGQHLYGVEHGALMAWYYPAGVMLGWFIGAAWLMLWRLRRVEVFA